MTPVNHTITTQVDLYRVMCGEESLAEYAVKIILSIEAEIALDVAYAMQDSFDNRTANFKETAFTPNAFIELATRVSAANGGRHRYGNRFVQYLANGRLSEDGTGRNL
mgnify:CR=1 FL=1